MIGYIDANILTNIYIFSFCKQLEKLNHGQTK